MEIDIFELLRMHNPTIIDIRSRDKYNKEHIPGAISLDYMDILLHPDIYLNSKDIYYFYCDSGVRSKILVQKLVKMGYSAISVVGGFNNYLLRK